MQYYFTIIGSRKVDFDNAKILAKIGVRLRQLGIITRTGDAVGCDQTCYSPETYLGSKFSADPSQLEIYTAKDFINDTDTNKILIDSIVGKYHPYWGTLTSKAESGDSKSQYSKFIHSRNIYQLIGSDFIRPITSEAVICWTPDGCEHHSTRTRDTGGSGTLVSLASMEYNIPVFNIQREGRLQEFYEFMKKFIAENLPDHSVAS